jgi:hypothetical protein
MRWTHQQRSLTIHRRQIVWRCRREDKEPAPKADVTLSVGSKPSEGNVKMLPLVVALAVFLGSFANATAQVYPSHAITLVAAGPAGGPTDAVGRIIAERMRVSLGQPVLIENVAASGGIAVAVSVVRRPTAIQSNSVTGARTSSTARPCRCHMIC